MDKGCYIRESDTLSFSGPISVSAISLTDAGVEIVKLRNDGAAEFNWPAIEKTAARWDAGSRDTWVSMARLLLLANNSAPTEHDAVAAERERCAAILMFRADKIAAEAERAVKSAPDEVSVLRAMAWQLTVAEREIRGA